MALRDQQTSNKVLAKQSHQLYQQALLAHHKNPIGFEKDIIVDVSQQGVNPACGDEITVNVTIEHSYDQAILKDIAFCGDSCAICRASASIMCQQVANLSIDEVKLLSAQLSAALSTDIALIGELAEQFSPLMMIQQFPVRKQCALLPWQTLEQILHCK